MSNAEAVKQAKETAKLDESLVSIPKKKYYPANKFFQKSSIQPWKRFQNPNFQNQYQNYNNNNNSNYSNYNNQKGKKWGQNQNQNQNKGKGRGRGTQKNSSNQKD